MADVEWRVADWRAKPFDGVGVSVYQSLHTGDRWNWSVWRDGVSVSGDDMESDRVSSGCGNADTVDEAKRDALALAEKAHGVLIARRATMREA